MAMRTGSYSWTGCSRKGFYFSFDAVLALTLISIAFGLILAADTGTMQDLASKTQQSLDADATAESAMQVSTRQTAQDMLTSAEQTYFLEQTELTEDDLDKPVIDTIAVLWASNETVEAQNLTQQFFDSIIPDGYDYRVTMDEDESFTVYNSSTLAEDQELVTRATRMISGVSRDQPTAGHIARAHLTEATAFDEQNVFFGGYVGDGNITMNVSLPHLHTVHNVTIEGDFAGDFDMAINGVDAGSYSPDTENLTADEFHICSTETNADRCEALEEGDNHVELAFDWQNRSSVSGGFLNVQHNRTAGVLDRGGDHRVEEERLPGIDGVINLYSAFQVPGALQSVDGHLNYTADIGTIFVTLGNATVYETEADGHTTVDLSNESIHGNVTDAGLSYSQLSGQTTPYRVGVEHESLLQGEAGAIDAVSATSVAGSMSSHGKIDEAQEGTRQFVNVILDTPDARAGLNAFNDFIVERERLTQDNETLQDTVDDYRAGGGTCVGCGILKGVNTLINRPIRQTVFSERSTWRYNVSDVDEDWMTQGYDDGDWGQGTAPLGYGGTAYTQAGDEETDTFRFRKTFDYAPDTFFNPHPYLQYAGDATVYLNGERIHTSRMNHSGQYWDAYLGTWEEMTGLWYRTDNRYLSDGTSWYFGLEEEYRYATEHHENGSLITPTVDLSTVSNPQLNYSHWLEVENRDDVYVEINDGTGWNELERYQGNSNGWQNVSIDIPGYTDDEVQVRFRFEPHDEKDRNTYEEGWYVDDVVIGGFDSNPVDRDLLNETDNVLAVELEPDAQTPVNDATNVSSFADGTFINTTETGDGVELDDATDGTYISDTITADGIVEWTEAVSSVSEPEGTDVSISYGTNNTGSWAYHNDISDVDNGRHLRFRADLAAEDAVETPSLHWLELNRSSYGVSFDGRLEADEVRTPSIVVMSDESSNQVTNMDDVEDYTGGGVGATDHTIEAACRANQYYGITVYAIAYDEDADQEELQAVADCGGGEFYFADQGDLEEMYHEVAQDIIRASFEGQRIHVDGNMTHELHPDSYLRFNYTPPEAVSFGAFSLTQTSDRFGGEVTSPKNGTFHVPENVEVSDVRVTSYSSHYWTDRLLFEEDPGEFEYAYRLWDYNTSYTDVGDPFDIHLPVEHVQEGENQVQLDTALAPDDTQGGSPDSRVMYTAEVDGSVGYGDVFPEYEGGNYTFDTVGGEVTVTVGNASHDWDASEDALGDAVERLIGQLDVTGDGVVDFHLDEDELEIESQSTGGIEWMWGPATMSLEVWRSE